LNTRTVHKMKTVFALVAAAVFFALSSNGEHCQVRLLTDCLRAISIGLSQPLNVDCSAVKRVEDCIKQTTSCNATDKEYKLYWSGPKDGINYMCNEKASEKEKLKACFQEKHVQIEAGFKTCENQSRASGETDECKQMNTALRCRRSIIEVNCGKELAKTYATFMYKVSKPAADDKKCHLENAAAKTGLGSLLLLSFIMVAAQLFA